jgi:hypothetical protein
MKIQENDFIIDHNGNSYVLHVKKTKGELKENPDSNFKVKGYHTALISSFRSAFRFRNHKKYPFKESKESLKSAIDKYNYIESELKKESSKLYNSIINSKKEILNEL